MVKKSEKLVSIIIRGKNESKWLKILFKELAKQSVKSFEIIFCDNNSTDNTLDILKKNKSPFVIQHSQGTPENMQKNPKYKNELLDIYDFFENKIKKLVQNEVQY